MVTSFFKHDSNARNDDKLIKLRMKHRAAGYGVYFMILERLRDETEHMSVKDYNIIAFDLREDASLIKSVIEDFGLFAFTEDGKCFYSERLLSELNDLDARRERRSNAGRMGMAKRWGTPSEDTHTQNQQKDNNVITMLSKSYNYIREDNIRKEISSPLPSPLSRVEDIEEDDDFLDFKDFFERQNEAEKYQSLFAGRKDINDRFPILRFLTDTEQRDAIIEFIKGWPEDRHLYELRQQFEGMERNGTIHPMSFDAWSTIVWLKSKLNLAELKRIIDKVKSGDHSTWEKLVDVVKSVKKNPKIEKPGNYIQKCLFNNN